MANKILNQFIEYYNGLSDDAKELVRDMVLTAPKKSSNNAPRAARSSQSKKKGLPASTPSTETVTVTVPAAHGASGGD